jgi:N-acetylmuramoyl-L-alanine amidase
VAVIRLKRPPFSGPQVRKLQQRLKALGYDVGSIDGVFGPSTDRCVKAFQGDH